MERGIRQGCPMSAQIFVLVVEILGILIRRANNVKGILVNNNEHKIVQYADDATLFVRDIKSIPVALNILSLFSTYAGPKLNLRKTKGIWLGPLKDLGIRVMNDITFTGNPIKCLGIYIGHNKEKCYYYNWVKKIEKIKNIANMWKRRNLTIFGRVHVIKTYIMSQIVYPASILTISDDIVKQIKEIVYEYLWKGKRDRVKRTAISNDIERGGLNMIDIDNFLRSLKAAWIPKIVNMKGKWCDYFYQTCKQIKLPPSYVFKTTVRKIENFPLYGAFSPFYQDVILSFNKCKTIKPLETLNVYDIIQQPLWGNEYFKLKSTCIYFKRWAECNILFVKDIVNDNGMMYCDKEMYNIIKDKQNIHQELYIFKNYVKKHLRNADLSIAPFVKIRNTTTLVYDNKLHFISDQKSRFFYQTLVSKSVSKPPMQTVFSKEFAFENQNLLWKSVYRQKVGCITIPKLKEFNYKILNNIVSCGYVISKWVNSVNKYCDVCGQIETTRHMLYECKRIKDIWTAIGKYIKCNFDWKLIVCGYIGYELTDKVSAINFISSVIAYAVFKVNSFCKYNQTSYANIDIVDKVKEAAAMYKVIMKESKCKNYLIDKYLTIVIEC